MNGALWVWEFEALHQGDDHGPECGGRALRWVNMVKWPIPAQLAVDELCGVVEWRCFASS